MRYLVLIILLVAGCSTPLTDHSNCDCDDSQITQTCGWACERGEGFHHYNCIHNKN